MSKSNHFFGQPLYGQLINLLDKEKNFIRNDDIVHKSAFLPPKIDF